MDPLHRDIHMRHIYTVGWNVSLKDSLKNLNYPVFFLKFIHRHDTNTCTTSLLRYIPSFFTASPSAYSLTSIFGEAGGAYLSKQRGKFAEELDSSGLKGYKRGREPRHSRETCEKNTCISPRTVLERNNRAGACCVQKARSYANVPNV